MELDNTNPLHKALLNDDHSSLQRLLKDVDVVAYRDKDDSTLLHLAASALNACVVKYLIEAGCDLNARNKNQDVPLHCVMKFTEIYMDERVLVVKLLLQAGAMLDLKNSYNEDPLHLCISSSGMWDDYDDVRTAKVLLDAGANVDIRDENNETPLQRVAHHNRSETVDLLLDYGADVSLRNDFGETALHTAARPGIIRTYNEKETHSRQLDTLKSLLSKGASVNLANSKGQTPFHYLLEGGNREAVELFIEHGADLSKRDSKLKGPMFYAAVNRDSSVLQLLLDKGCELEERDCNGRTPLYRVVKRTLLRNLRFLCEKGADINSQDTYGMTPLYALMEYQYSFKSFELELLVDAMIDLGADVNALTASDEMLLDMIDYCKTDAMPGAKYFLLKLFAKLEFLGIEIDYSQIEDIESDEEEFAEYYERCFDELALINKFTFHDALEILPIFTGEQRVVASYARNDKVTAAFDAINFSELFPIYGEGIKERFAVERAKHQLRKDAFDILSECLPGKISTAVVVREILSYLDDKALVASMRNSNKYYVNYKTENVHLCRKF